MSDSEYKPITIGNWLVTLILLVIPLVNIIMLIVWAASGSTHPSKKTFAQAYLVLIGIIICIGFLVGLILPFFWIHHTVPAATQ
jgi:hypothetical protein